MMILIGMFGLAFFGLILLQISYFNRTIDGGESSEDCLLWWGVWGTILFVGGAVWSVITIVRQKRLSELKNEFINNMTHEFKTPIATITLAAEMLKDKSVEHEPGTIERVATMIHEESDRLTAQVERVLQMALFSENRMKLTRKEVRINTIVKDLLPKFALLVEDKGGHVSGRLDAREDRVWGDEVHITNVIANLVDNAIKYATQEPEITISTCNKNQEIVISVKDNGIGIAKKDQKLIFERFYRVSAGKQNGVKGFGLGLSYVKKIVEAHGGRMELESSPGKGSRFDVILPLISKKRKPGRTLFF